METPLQLTVRVADGGRIQHVGFFPLHGTTLAMVVDCFETVIGPVLSISDSGGYELHSGIAYDYEVI